MLVLIVYLYLHHICVYFFYLSIGSIMNDILNSKREGTKGTVSYNKIQIENTIYLIHYSVNKHQTRTHRAINLTPTTNMGFDQSHARTHTRAHASPYILLSSCSLLMFSDNFQCTRYIIMIFNSTLFYIYHI